jgi:hypothetical protein
MRAIRPRAIPARNPRAFPPDTRETPRAIPARTVDRPYRRLSLAVSRDARSPPRDTGPDSEPPVPQTISRGLRRIPAPRYSPENPCAFPPGPRDTGPKPAVPQTISRGLRRIPAPRYSPENPCAFPPGPRDLPLAPTYCLPPMSDACGSFCPSRADTPSRPERIASDLSRLGATGRAPRRFKR